MLKGPLFIASTVKSATEKEIKDAENEYKKGTFGVFPKNFHLAKNSRKILRRSNRLFRWQFARPSLSEGDSQCRRVQG